MKNIFFLTLILSISAFFSQTVKAQTEAQRIDLCVKFAGDATYLSDYPVQLAVTSDGERAPIYKQTIALRKGNRYRFTICTDEESAGEAVLKLYNEGKMIGSSFNPETGKEYRSFDFDCNKFGYYVIMVSFKDGKNGSAIGILSHVKTL